MPLAVTVKTTFDILGQRMLDYEESQPMQCSEVMNRNVKVISESEPTAMAAEMMSEHDIGFIPVCDTARKKLVGTITDRDITLRLVGQRKPPDTPGK